MKPAVRQLDRDRARARRAFDELVLGALMRGGLRNWPRSLRKVGAVIERCSPERRAALRHLHSADIQYQRLW